MSERSTARSAPLSDPPAAEAGTVFGLDVSCNLALPFLAGACAAASGRELRIEVLDPTRSASMPWPSASELICDQREPDGSISYRIESHRQAGYLISGPSYGQLRLSADGDELTCLPSGSGASGAWQRLLIAQALPFAALLQGLEVFHASAAVVDDEAIAFLGASRAGKTSLALDLCRRGASFLADDVVAVEREDALLLAHPGTPVAGLDHAEAERLGTSGEESQHEVVTVNERERIVRVRPADGPAPLGTMFLLDRRPDGPSTPRFEPVASGLPLLSATFNFVLAGAERQRRLLDVCALAAQGRVERISIGPGCDASAVGAAVRARLSLPA